MYGNPFFRFQENSPNTSGNSPNTGGQMYGNSSDGCKKYLFLCILLILSVRKSVSCKSKKLARHGRKLARQGRRLMYGNACFGVQTASKQNSHDKPENSHDTVQADVRKFARHVQNAFVFMYLRSVGVDIFCINVNCFYAWCVKWLWCMCEN